MFNRITYNPATQNHTILLFILVFCWINTTSLWATSLSVNVYLKLQPKNEVTHLIKQFNHTLEKNKVFSLYHITPFLTQYPLHLTLYLTSYEKKNIAQVISQIKKIAQQNYPVHLTTTDFNTNKSGYTMLVVKNTPNLHLLSNQIIHALAPLHDKNTLIPSWAVAESSRRVLFATWGSPNVFAHFKPHFSLMEPHELTTQEQVLLVKKIHLAINHFNLTHKTTVETTAIKIGIGIANEQGQITQELTEFKLG
ncbi:MAG: 2'-5' RNA ligase family protein [bacterium]|nr:2'-5' RNA ligase family protein [bacterium]